MDELQQHQTLLKTVVRLQKLNLFLLAICGILSMTSFLQSFTAHPEPWIMAPFPIALGTVLLLRRKIRRMRGRLWMLQQRMTFGTVLDA